VVCDRAGAYRLELPGEPARTFAVRMPAESESAIRMRPLPRPPAARAATRTRPLFEGRLWPLLAACALLLVLLEWLTFHRRWTV
jgi:hypothetical protein